ncbi:MAG: Tm-1-like ATP-binding domain-containing protein [Rhodospirillales bacterium]|jgi:uncharacterized protein (UPF0261 family)|nr:Tm-1-like ATP-binding domain-containing protein [Rhodospirillales bacterium]|tara:strand:- start:1395 stop:2573 length:1179 start_codon:yes stop_codon:yes gene_type:complete
MNNHGPVLVIGTIDTKKQEIDYLVRCLEILNCEVRLLDTSLDPVNKAMDDKQKLQTIESVVSASLHVVQQWVGSGDVKAVIGLGGGIGTWISLGIIHRLPLGLPKVLISTLPFDVREFTAKTDIVVIPAVVDILGLNSILRMVFRKAATIIEGLLTQTDPEEEPKPAIGLTALGVTNTAVRNAQQIFEKKGFEIATFHANGWGGTAFEECIASGIFEGVLDLTTTEVAALLFGGVIKPASGRLESAVRSGVPQVVAPGGISFVTRGPLESLNQLDKQRLFYRHSPSFTHVRLTKEELCRVAVLMAEKLNQAVGPVAVALPMQGFSSEDRVGGAIYDIEGNEGFSRALKASLRPSIPVVEVDAHINDRIFVSKASDLLLEMLNASNRILGKQE